MASYRIVCTVQVPVSEPTTRAHIVNVGTGTDPDQADRRWSVDEVLRAIDSGDDFYTLGRQTGRRAAVHKYICGGCHRTFVRSGPDAVTDNNLDSLRTCNWP
jgi:hypothetical protein